MMKGEQGGNCGSQPPRLSIGVPRWRLKPANNLGSVLQAIPPAVTQDATNQFMAAAEIRHRAAHKDRQRAR
jgi:hypothetical protein